MEYENRIVYLQNDLWNNIVVEFIMPDILKVKSLFFAKNTFWKNLNYVKTIEDINEIFIAHQSRIFYL